MMELVNWLNEYQEPSLLFIILNIAVMINVILTTKLTMHMTLIIITATMAVIIVMIVMTTYDLTLLNSVTVLNIP